jgi:hypothetical protein
LKIHQKFCEFSGRQNKPGIWKKKTQKIFTRVLKLSIASGELNKIMIAWMLMYLSSMSEIHSVENAETFVLTYRFSMKFWAFFLSALVQTLMSLQSTLLNAFLNRFNSVPNRF